MIKIFNYALIFTLILNINVSFVLFGQGYQELELPTIANSTCIDNGNEFVPPSGQNLCDSFPDNLFIFEIGKGSSSQIENSHQLAALGNIPTQYIKVVGDFEIDFPYTFQNKILKISKNVQITIKYGWDLTLDHSVLFCCNNMWRGIYHENLTKLITKNYTIIEDALTAINATNTQGVILSIDRTNFNRNRIGIFLQNNYNDPLNPKIIKFIANSFSCSRPMFHPEIVSYAGILTKNVSLYLNSTTLKSSYLSTKYNGLKFGIYSYGDIIDITLRGQMFKNIKYYGVNLLKGNLDVKASVFEDVFANGINIDLSIKTTIINTDFNYTPSIFAPISGTSKGVFIRKLAINSRSTFQNLTIEADLNSHIHPIFGVDIQGESVEANSNISITKMIAKITSSNSAGVRVNGSFPLTSSISIVDNYFEISSPLDQILFQNLPLGILIVGGNKHNVDISFNRFFCPYHSATADCIRFENSPLGTNASIMYNQSKVVYGTPLIRNYNTNFIVLIDVSDLKICSNSMSSREIAIPFTFKGTNIPCYLTQNNIEGCSSGVQIHRDALIGKQIHEGNRWIPLYDPLGPFGFPLWWLIKEAAFIVVPLQAKNNQFLVHTNQSQSEFPDDPNLYFSEFYPLKIIPNDPIYDFFKSDLAGDPRTECTSLQLNNNSNISEIDSITIYQSIDSISNNYCQSQIIIRQLINKLTKNPTLINNSSIQTFISNLRSTQNYQFTVFDSLIEVANQYNANINIDSLNEIQVILIDSLSLLNDSISESIIIAALSQLSINNAYYSNYRTNYLIFRDSILQLAEIYLNSIIPINQQIANEKLICTYLISSLLNENSFGTFAEWNNIINISNLNSDENGYGVLRARSFLRSCETVDHYPIDTNYLFPPNSIPVIDIPITKEDKSLTFIITPNPNKESFNIQMKNKISNPIFIRIFDLNGRTVLFDQSNLDKDVRIDHHLSTGVYYIQIINNGDIENHKFFVSK